MVRSLRLRSRHDGGFTLVEVVVVMLLSAVLMSLSATGWVSYQRKAELRQSVDELVSTLRKSQQAAFTEATSYCVVFVVGDSTYQVRRGGCTSSHTAVGGPQRLKSTRVQLQDPNFKQPDGSTAANLVFTARGSATKGSVVVRRADGSGRTYTVSVEGLTARVSVA